MDTLDDVYYEEGKKAFYQCARWENPYEPGSYAAKAWDAGYDSEAAEAYGEPT